MIKKKEGERIEPLLAEHRVIIKMDPNIWGSSEESHVERFLKAGFRCFELAAPLSLNLKEISALGYKWRNELDKLVKFDEVVLGIKADVTSTDEREAFRHTCFDYFTFPSASVMPISNNHRYCFSDCIRTLSSLTEIAEYGQSPFRLFIPVGIDKKDYTFQIDSEFDGQAKMIIETELNYPYLRSDWITYFFKSGVVAIYLDSKDVIRQIDYQHFHINKTYEKATSDVFQSCHALISKGLEMRREKLATKQQSAPV